MTHSSNEAITDSAAAGTAFATGKKTDNGVIGLSPDGEELPTIVDIAKQAGKRTGLVSTSTITHATPAAFAAKVESRGSYTEIAKQMIETTILICYLEEDALNFSHLKAAEFVRTDLI
ncbi:alkaline phosphatase [Bacillus sp. JCM 19046]|nr:alkaline phosphatase [Bacillus sp. JCM 19046]